MMMQEPKRRDLRLLVIHPEYMFYSTSPITITNRKKTRFLKNLDEAVALVKFAFEHAEPEDLFVQKADAPIIGDLEKELLEAERPDTFF